MYIYLESVLGYNEQSKLAKEFRTLGYDVYNSKEVEGFKWSKIDLNWRNWTNTQYLEALQHLLVTKDYEHCQKAMLRADAFVLVNPSGLAEHLVAGWALGRGIPSAIFLSENFKKPTTIHKLFGPNIFTSYKEMTQWLEEVAGDCGKIPSRVSGIEDRGTLPTAAGEPDFPIKEFDISTLNLPGES